MIVFLKILFLKKRNSVLNFNLGYINVNSIGGFKFYEIRFWFFFGRFDVLIILESKIDVIFLDSMFYVDGL